MEVLDEMKWLFRNIKNIRGWRTKRKLVVLAVDDYGNVRVHSKKARLAMNSAGLRMKSRFDAFDALETRQDLELLFETLSSVQDRNGKHAVFTPFALPCNIDFERMKDNGYEEYFWELLPETYSKVASEDPQAYEGAWSLWKSGISEGLMVPEFHGREHINLKVFREKLAKKDRDLLLMLDNHSFTSISASGDPAVKCTAAFAFSNRNEIVEFPEIMESGTTAFKRVYGNNPIVFTPPAHQYPLALESSLCHYGIRVLDKPFVSKEHLGGGKYKKIIRSTCYDTDKNLVQLVRNVVFEPTHPGGFDSVGSALKDIEAAFRWNRPAVISSHRVNFCGHIDPRNRNEGLSSLKNLLVAIIKRWPDAEFLSARQLGGLILKTNQFSNI